MDSTQAMQLRESLVGKEVGGWLLDGYFGKGKSAVVFSATREGQKGALKVFHPELVERYGKDVQLQRILREKGLVGAEHPHLVQILDGGECPTTGHLFVVMERLPYRNIHEALLEIPSEAVPSLIAQVASAARFLEDRGLAHRDIKPENIAVTDNFSRAILLDLGVLRPIGLSNLTDVDQRSFIGTLRYSSPEFLLRQELDTPEGWRAVTFYQLGGVLHDMLMKRVLFDDHSEPFAQLAEAVKSVKPEIYANDARCAALARHCLIKNPATRLELVSWTDFANLVIKGEAGEISAARDRILARQKFFRSAQGTTEAPASESRRILRLTLLAVCNRLESRIASIINDLGCFPLREVRSEANLEAKRCTTRIDFERDEALGLAYRLSVLLEIELIDENAGDPVFKVASSAIFADVEPNFSGFRPPVPFFTGDLPTLLDNQKLAEQFTDALEAAYTAQDQGRLPDANTPLCLTKEPEKS